MFTYPITFMKDPAASGGVQLVYDTFTQGSSVLLTSHTPDVDTEGGGWSMPGGNVVASAGDYAYAAQTNGIGLIDCGEADVQIDMDVVNSADHGIMARYSSTSSYWVFKSDGKLYEWNGSSLTQRGSSVSVPSLPFTLHLSCDGQTMEYWINDGSSQSYGSASRNETSTQHGMRWYSTGTSYRADNFEITSL